jgi:ubiquitin C-terminal hydrolase
MRLANKQLSIEAYPKVLMLQLKRFKQVNGKKVKNNEVIQYPEVLEVPEGKRYRLNGVVVHEGSL